MLVSEIFHSIQGEGESIGIPVIFIRLAGCNLRCSWCDTKYAYEGNQMSIKDVAEVIKGIDCKHVIFTGGEPMLQEIEMYALIDYLREKRYASFFEVETNGTIFPDREKFEKINKWNVSPKVDKIDVVKKWRELDALVYFKFVIEKKEDVEELENVKAMINLYHKKYVYFMPEGQTRAELQKKSKWVIAECKRLGIRFSPRLQVDIWGKKRGV